MNKQLLGFEQEQARRGAYARGDRGNSTVEISRVKGSVGRAGELNHRFQPRRRHFTWGTSLAHSQRTDRVRQLFASGHVPAVELYQIDNDYFVVDGHHRLRVAIERGQEYVEAHVIEYLPDRADPANAVFYERAAFVHATGLRDVHATEVGRYPRLLNRIRDHRHELIRFSTDFQTTLHTENGAPLSVPTATPHTSLDLRRAAQDWYEREYEPVVEVLTAERILTSFPGRVHGDLYGYVSDHRWYLSERRGWDVGIDAALVEFVHRHSTEQLAETLVDPIVALGADLLDQETTAPLGWLRGWSSNSWATFAAGCISLPIAFIRGLRPHHYRLPRPGLSGQR